MANATKTVLFEGFVFDGEYRVTLSKNAHTAVLLEKKDHDVLGQPCWQLVKAKADDTYLYVIMTALAALLTKDA